MHRYKRMHGMDQLGIPGATGITAADAHRCSPAARTTRRATMATRGDGDIGHIPDGRGQPTGLSARGRCRRRPDLDKWSTQHRHPHHGRMVPHHLGSAPRARPSPDPDDSKWAYRIPRIGLVVTAIGLMSLLSVYSWLGWRDHGNFKPAPTRDMHWPSVHHSAMAGQHAADRGPTALHHDWCRHPICTAYRHFSRCKNRWTEGTPT